MERFVMEVGVVETGAVETGDVEVDAIETRAVNQLDNLHLKGIRGYGYTGVFPEENVLGQWFEADLEIKLDLRPSGRSDDLTDTLHYGEVVTQVQEILQRSRFALIERLATVIAEAVLAYPQVHQVRVCLTKMTPPIPDFSGQVQVEIVRSKGF
ncbi:MAG: dihydroneopterin aldolase [Thermosynechococcaceae cyanobacterium MS004]|nr:dihydroneopterin aldolase [Thermosynechococcaceae cyanobacterium MS004]